LNLTSSLKLVLAKAGLPAFRLYEKQKVGVNFARAQSVQFTLAKEGTALASPGRRRGSINNSKFSVVFHDAAAA
jgi:hypothetical protein